MTYKAEYGKKRIYKKRKKPCPKRTRLLLIKLDSLIIECLRKACLIAIVICFFFKSF